MKSNGSIGEVTSLWRYPVKSMMGEQLMDAYFTPQGMLGDRAYALIDRATGKVASAKNPRKWPTLFSFSASYAKPPEPFAAIPPVLIALPDAVAASAASRPKPPACWLERLTARWHWPAGRRRTPTWRSTGRTWILWRIATR